MSDPRRSLCPAIYDYFPRDIFPKVTNLPLWRCLRPQLPRDHPCVAGTNESDDDSTENEIMHTCLRRFASALV